MAVLIDAHNFGAPDQISVFFALEMVDDNLRQCVLAKSKVVGLAALFVCGQRMNPEVKSKIPGSDPCWRYSVRTWPCICTQSASLGLNLQ